MKHPSVFVFLPLIASALLSCASPTSSTAFPAPISSIVKPGDTLGETVLEIAKDETGEPDIFTYCSPLIAESDPRVMVRTCNVPQLPYLFIGYGELADTQEELESLWKSKNWQLYFDEHAVDLASFGFFDMDWEGYRLRRWKIAVENLPPGEHSLHYISSSAEQQLLVDIIWVFTVGGPTSSSSSRVEKILYPTLSSETVAGQHPYTSEKAGLNFWLYLPTSYGKDAEQKWPLTVSLHGGGGRGSNNLDTMLIGGLPKKLILLLKNAPLIYTVFLTSSKLVRQAWLCQIFSVGEFWLDNTGNSQSLEHPRLVGWRSRHHQNSARPEQFNQSLWHRPDNQIRLVGDCAFTRRFADEY